MTEGKWWIVEIYTTETYQVVAESAEEAQNIAEYDNPGWKALRLEQVDDR